MRVLIIKVETDEDLDPSLSQRSWSEALALAQELGDAGWVNRPRGELEVTALVHRGAEPGELALIEHGVEEHDRSIMRPGAVGFRKRLSGSPMAAQSGLVVDVKHPPPMELPCGHWGRVRAKNITQ